MTTTTKYYQKEDIEKEISAFEGIAINIDYHGLLTKSYSEYHKGQGPSIDSEELKTRIEDYLTHCTLKH